MAKIKNKIKFKLKAITLNIPFEIESQLNLEKLIEIIHKDLKNYAKKDPSTHGSLDYILDSYYSFYALMCYRLAHSLYVLNYKNYARSISEFSKVKTGIEIHPGAQIGEGFVLDHGIGTVIGESVIIGNDVYILQCVVLGSSNISNNIGMRRHPIIGDNVDIGGFVKILGNIIIGNNVKISPGAVIKESIPENTKVIIGSLFQIMKSESNLKFTGFSNIDKQLIFYFDKKSVILSEIEILKNSKKLNFENIDNSLVLNNIFIKEGEYLLRHKNKEIMRITI